MPKKKKPQRPNKPRQANSNSTRPLGAALAGPTFDRFWGLIARVGATSGGDLTRACAAFRAELEALDDAALLEMNECFHAAMLRAYDGILWSAASLMHGGCSDDAFWDFRSGLVALGRQLYERGLRDPDSLAEVPAARLPKEPTREMVDEDLLQIRFPAIAEKFA